MLTFIVNPNAGGEKGFSTWKICERRLQKLEIPYKVFITDGPGDAINLARQATESGEEITIVPVGGDGTFNEVLNGLNISDNVTLGYIPTGSGNDLARGLKLSGDPEEALDTVLKKEKVIKLDYGELIYGREELITRRFIVSTGIGYDAAVCVAIDQSSLRRGLSKFKLQKQVYLMLGALEIFKTKPATGYVLIDDSKRIDFKDIMFVSSQIHVTEGGGKKFTPQADPCDGLLSCCVMCSKNQIDFFKTLLPALEGNHKDNPNCTLFDCKNIKIHADKPLAIHTDGEIFEYQTDVEVKCIGQKLNMIV